MVFWVFMSSVFLPLWNTFGFDFRYQEYKSEYITTQKQAFFDSHKDEEWYFLSLISEIPFHFLFPLLNLFFFLFRLRDKYHPTNLVTVIERCFSHHLPQKMEFL